MPQQDPRPLSPEELAAETAAPLPDKEVVSLLDLNADLDLAIDAAAPIDLAVAANANVAAPIDAAVAANVLSTDSTAQALADQGALIDQGITGEATATAPQDSTIDQVGNDAAAGDAAVPSGDAAAVPAPTAPDGGAGTTEVGDALSGDLLDVDVDLNADADIAAPIAGAVAANANVAAPIDAAVAANVGSVGSEAVAVAQQDAIITQDINADATATADQQSSIDQ
ncbi:hypothetical protein ACI782_05520 [Geodermatophilus sp. SYSU D00703]